MWVSRIYHGADSAISTPEQMSHFVRLSRSLCDGKDNAQRDGKDNAQHAGKDNAQRAGSAAERMVQQGSLGCYPLLHEWRAFSCAVHQKKSLKMPNGF